MLGVWSGRRLGDAQAWAVEYVRGMGLEGCMWEGAHGRTLGIAVGCVGIGPGGDLAPPGNEHSAPSEVWWRGQGGEKALVVE